MHHVLSEAKPITDSYPITVGTEGTHRINTLVSVVQLEVLKHFLEEGDAHEPIIGNLPVGQNGLETRERAQVNLASILS